LPIQPPKHPSVPTKKTEPSKHAAPIGAAASVAAPSENPEVIKGKTFNHADEVPGAFTGTFEGCTFNMKELKGKNLQAKFKGCTFARDLKFVECNLYGAEGLPRDVKMVDCLAPMKKGV
jgi:hypothetical protein